MKTHHVYAQQEEKVAGGAERVIFAVAGFVLFLIGFISCFTLIGLLWGLPFMAGGVAMMRGVKGKGDPVLLATQFVDGNCPHCGGMITALLGKTQIYCPVYQQSVIVKNGSFLTPD